MKVKKSFSIDEECAIKLELISRIIGTNESKLINELIKEKYSSDKAKELIEENIQQILKIPGVLQEFKNTKEYQMWLKVNEDRKNMKQEPSNIPEEEEMIYQEPYDANISKSWEMIQISKSDNDII